MTPHYQDDLVTLYAGDCLDVLRELPDGSVDAVVTDPPYELGFMGKGWDASGIAYNVDLWRDVLRVLKPGGHLLAFGGTRTWHRLACAIEDAGFEIRDSIAWMYGSGFPKSLDVSKAIDKRGGAVAGFEAFRDAVRAAMQRNGVSRAELTKALGNHMLSHYLTAGSQPAVPNVKDYRIIRDTVGLGHDWDHLFAEEAEREVVGTKTAGIADKNEGPRHTIGASKAVIVDITAPATPDAARWQGWGTALKPAHEPIVVARKPLTGTVAANVLEHGTGALNIDACRIGMSPEDRANIEGRTWVGRNRDLKAKVFGDYATDGSDQPMTVHPSGRWPANVVLDEHQAAELDKQSGDIRANRSVRDPNGSLGYHGGAKGLPDVVSGYEDTGGASRFFYTAKAGTDERPRVDGVAHPTVKPVDLMRWLVRLVTPPGGTVLEPFAGSGTTAEACVIEGLHCIAIEREADYLPLIVQRLSRPIQPTLGDL